MKRVRTILLSVVIVALNFSLSFAQQELAMNIEDKKKGAFHEDITIEEEDLKETIPHYYRQQKKLATFFTGVAIELTTSDLPLYRDYVLFERFGNVMMAPLKNGGFSYVITGFRNEKAAKSFLKSIVIHSAPEAKVIVYKRGKRKVKK